MSSLLLLKTGGIIALFAVIFAESGLLAGFFLPGDSLLFTAGFLASQGHFNIWVMLIGSCVAAIVGDSTGYVIGRKFGPKVFHKKEGFFFHQDHVEKAQKFFEAHGKKTIILARFIPIVRTFVPTIAGVGKMHYQTFVTYNIIGGVIWTFGLIGGGYLFGQSIPNADRYLLPIIAGIIVISVTPPAIQAIKLMRRKQNHAKEQQ